MLVGLVLLILMLAILGWLTYLITTKIPMSDIFQQLIQVVVVIVVVIYVLGLITGKASLPTLPNF
jgi:hypothetical protein